MKKYRYLCFYANLSSNALFISSLDQIQRTGKIDSISLFIYLFIYLFKAKTLFGK